MALIIASEPTASEDQLYHYNSSVMVKRHTFSPPQGEHWAVIGLVLSDAFDPLTDEVALISDIEALVDVTNVDSPRVYGQLPSSILPGVEYEFVLYSTSLLNCTSGYPQNQRSYQEQQVGTVKPPINKKWLVARYVLPSTPIDQTAVDTLESNLEGILGVTVAKLLLNGQIPDPSTSISQTIEARVRLDKV